MVEVTEMIEVSDILLLLIGSFVLNFLLLAIVTVISAMITIKKNELETRWGIEDYIANITTASLWLAVANVFLLFIIRVSSSYLYLLSIVIVYIIAISLTPIKKRKSGNRDNYF